MCRWVLLGNTRYMYMYMYVGSRVHIVHCHYNNRVWHAPGATGYICVYIAMFMADLRVWRGCDGGGREEGSEGGREDWEGGGIGRMNNFQC